MGSGTLLLFVALEEKTGWAEGWKVPKLKNEEASSLPSAAVSFLGTGEPSLSSFSNLLSFGSPGKWPPHWGRGGGCLWDAMIIGQMEASSVEGMTDHSISSPLLLVET